MMKIVCSRKLADVSAGLILRNIFLAEFRI